MACGSASATVGALACQRHPYQRTLEARVVACRRATTGEPWQVECSDSVLFPQGGGQPWDHGTIALLPSEGPSEPIPIRRVERQGLRCVLYAPQPLRVGDKVLQTVDFGRRWHHMQQHTGQHLVSTVAQSEHGLRTLGWGMGEAGAMNYVDLQRKPSAEEIRAIQDKCNKLVQENLPIHVSYPDAAQATTRDKGVLRVVSIGRLDRNECCGTHLRQTSHISAVLMSTCQSVNAQRHRLYFVAGDRALDHAAASTQCLLGLARQFLSGSSPDDIAQQVSRMQRSVDDLKRREKRLLAHVARLETERVKTALRAGGGGWIYHADGGAELLAGVKVQLKDIANTMTGTLVVATGEPDGPGQVLILGPEEGAQAVASDAHKLMPELKGHGHGRIWQGKVARWNHRELDALQKLAEA